MNNLLSSAAVGMMSVNNRVTMAALTRMRAGEDGVPTPMHAEYYAQRASAGFVVTEGTFLSFRSRGFAGQAGIANSAQQLGWAGVAKAVHERGGVLVMQLMHAGRMSHQDLTRGQQPEAPSAIAAGVQLRTSGGKLDAPVPHAMNAEDLERVKAEFVAGARRAIDAGLDAVEIHGANGYLLHEFLSPAANHREDAYGGSPSARARFVAEVIRAVAEEIGAQRTALRISPEHNIQGCLELDPEETRATYRALLEQIADLDLAYLSILHANPESRLVQELRHLFGGFTVVNTGFAEVTQQAEAEAILERGLGDAVAVGRLFIANPDLPRRWAEGADLNEPDMATFYVGGARGYIDYPSLG
ncbi:alkene reductase [Corynebacterium gerontici]|uniref:N-ethylmaleimide reductase n=1 Tax=Corynebacterium gerontici TaxID=2079234 RepID=A0A3G6J5I4_9CORY|nr:alkene reductase [Corynebacterium gerontici]AZA12188.1 N-ethylmaleimide reductase [Corynebacterium gerontici]